MSRKIVVLFVAIIVVLGIIVIAFFPVMARLLAYFIFDRDDLWTKVRIDNPYVDSRYLEWQSVQIDNVKPFKIPNDWSLEKEGQLYIIKDNERKVWAYGGVCGETSDLFNGTRDIISTFYGGATVTDYEVDLTWGTTVMKGSSLCRVSVILNNTPTIFYEIWLRADNNVAICFIPTLCLEKSTNDRNIAEAILFSFAY